MARPKGLPKTGGRRMQTPNKLTGTLREMICTFLTENWQQAKADFKTLEPKDRLAFYDRLLAYGLPKPAPEQIETEVETKKDLAAVMEMVHNKLVASNEKP